MLAGLPLRDPREGIPALNVTGQAHGASRCGVSAGRSNCMLPLPHTLAGVQAATFVNILSARRAAARRERTCWMLTGAEWSRSGGSEGVLLLCLCSVQQDSLRGASRVGMIIAGPKPLEACCACYFVPHRAAIWQEIVELHFSSNRGISIRCTRGERSMCGQNCVVLEEHLVR